MGDDFCAPGKDASVKGAGRKGASGEHSQSDRDLQPVAFESNTSNEKALFILKRDRSTPRLEKAEKGDLKRKP